VIGFDQLAVTLEAATDKSGSRLPVAPLAPVQHLAVEHCPQ